jgi:hypothetical protein
MEVTPVERATDTSMRIIVAGPPKSGNVWVDHLLSNVYDLEILDRLPGYNYWDPGGFAERVGDLDGSTLPEHFVFHEHFWPTESFLALVSQFDIRLVTPIRSPYDIFVSLYFYAQRFYDVVLRREGPEERLVARPLDHPEVFGFLERDFAPFIEHGLAWIRSGASTIVRYEDLHADTMRTLKAVTITLAPVDDDSIARAVEASRPERVRQNRPDLQKHIRTATVGDWRLHLLPEHLEIFRSVHGPMIRELGYTVAEPSEVMARPAGSASSWSGDVFDDLRRAYQEIANQKLELEQVHTEVVLRDRIVADLHQESERRRAEIEQLHREVAARDRIVADLRREVAQRDKTIPRLHREVARRDRIVADLHQESESRRAEIEHLHREVAVRDRIVADLHREVAQCNETIPWLHREVAVRDQLVADLHREIERLHREVARRDQLVADLHQEVAKCDETIPSLHQELAH